MRKSTTESPTQLNTYEVLGDNLRIHFEEEAVNTEATEDFDASVSYKYVTAYTTKAASRAEIVEAVMRCFYPSYGAEIASIPFVAQMQAAIGMTHDQLDDLFDAAGGVT